MIVLKEGMKMDINEFMQTHMEAIIIGAFLFIVIIIFSVMLFRGKKSSKLLTEIGKRLGLEPRRFGASEIEYVKDGFRVVLNTRLRSGRHAQTMLLDLNVYHKGAHKYSFECSDLGISDISSLTGRVEISRLWRSTDIPGLEKTGIFLYGKEKSQALNIFNNEDMKNDILNLHNILKPHYGGFLIDNKRVIVEVDISEEGIITNDLLKLLMKISEKICAGVNILYQH